MGGQALCVLKEKEKKELRTVNLYHNPEELDEILQPRTDFPVENAPSRGVHLYHFPLSSDCQKVQQALDEAKVKYTSHYVSLPKFEQYDPKYAQLNPRCVIPTLVVDGRVTTDAANIIAYIDDNYMGVPKKFLGFFLDEGKSLYPTEPKEQDLVTHFSDLGESLFLGPLTFAKLPGVEHVDVTNGATNAAYEPKRRAKKMQMVKDFIKKTKWIKFLRTRRISLKLWKQQNAHSTNLLYNSKMDPFIMKDGYAARTFL